jgi:hypothetical protein
MLQSSGIYRRVVLMWTEVSASHLLQVGFLLCWFSTQKTEVISSSETSVQVPTTRRYVLEDGNIHNYRCENLKSYIIRDNFNYKQPVSNTTNILKKQMYIVLILIIFRIEFIDRNNIYTIYSSHRCLQWVISDKAGKWEPRFM